MLEAADDVTQGATKGNSGIIHAGFDDKPGSVRAKYCWPGNQMFPQLDRELHFGFQATGSLVVARSDEDVALLHELLERGKQNGVQNLRIIDQKELREREPHLDKECVAALLSPDAGTIVPYEYTIALAENACDNGVEVRTRRQVVSIAQPDKAPTDGGQFTITVKHWEPPEYTPTTNDDTHEAYPVGGADGQAEPWAYSPSPGTTMGGTATTETYRATYTL